MIKIFFIAFLLLLGFNLIEVHPPNHQGYRVRIDGEISNLPNGTAYLVHVPDRKKKIDSAIIENGKFEFNLLIDHKQKFANVTVIAQDNSDTLREFIFPSNVLYKGKTNFLDHFILEENITINGSLSEFRIKGLLLPEKYQLTRLSQAPVGKQSWLLYNITPKFPDSLSDDKKFASLKELVQKYPYSYFLLDRIEKHISVLSDTQLNELLAAFDSNIKQTILWDQLKMLNRDLKSEHKFTEFKAMNLEDHEQKILDTTKLNVIIFWASWCAPCIQEIPELKDLHTEMENGRRINMVSISFDNDNMKWRRALNTYRMPWNQLIASSEEKQRQIFFNFKIDGAIPCILIIDHQGSILKKLQGYDKSVSIRDEVSKLL